MTNEMCGDGNDGDDDGEFAINNATETQPLSVNGHSTHKNGSALRMRAAKTARYFCCVLRPGARRVLARAQSPLDAGVLLLPGFPWDRTRTKPNAAPGLSQAFESE